MPEEVTRLRYCTELWGGVLRLQVKSFSRASVSTEVNPGCVLRSGMKKKKVKQSDYKRLTVFKSLNKTQKETNKRVSCKALVNIQQSGISGRKHLHESIIKLHCRADSQKKKTRKETKPCLCISVNLLQIYFPK